MALSRDAILNRLENGQIFKQDTWTCKALHGASYGLRVASDGLMLGGKQYLPEQDHVPGEIEIKPGEIAILSTIERLDMPGDLVGRIGIRFDYASRGLTGMMGIQVDPYFGWGHDNERLYMRVANLGNDPVSITPSAEVFTFELQYVSGFVPQPEKPRLGMWYRLQNNLATQSNASWSNVTQVQLDVSKVQESLEAQGDSLDQRIDSARDEIRNYLQPLVMFGIFLVAVTILGVVLVVSQRWNQKGKGGEVWFGRPGC